MIEQAAYERSHNAIQLKSQTAGFSEAWLLEAERLIVGFGDPFVADTLEEWGHCVFAQPLAQRSVAVVRVHTQGIDESRKLTGLVFRFFILPRSLYTRLGGDPFHLVEQFMPAGEVSPRMLTDDQLLPAPFRSVQNLKQILDAPNSATLLGGVQALLDGGRLVFERTAPDSTLLRKIWALLPTSSRAELWPASFAFGNALGFHVLVVPRAITEDYPFYHFEEQAGDYPEGRYESSLQHAVESGDQPLLDSLLNRRSRTEMIRLALWLLAAFILIPLILALIPGK